MKKRKEKGRAKNRRKVAKKPNGARRWGLQTVQTPKISVSGTSTIAISRQLQYCAKSPKMADRRRINGPPGGTRPPVFASLQESSTGIANRAQRQRQPTELRKICMNRRQAFLLIAANPQCASSQNRIDSNCLRLFIP